jgi:SpoVK/Ycf46/Vps4 family AAA+-type ATPase
LGLCLSDPPTNKGKLIIPQNSMEKAVTRLREQDAKKSSHVVKDYKTVAEDEYEKALITAVIPPSEVGVKFDHIGALENVKTTLQELVTLPLQRPELFSRGNLTRPCKGVLLFGPPGTGKTLLAKAVATEAGANFINITGSTITSKWFGDAEKLTKALFSLARKLSPSVIFVDEVRFLSIYKQSRGQGSSCNLLTVCCDDKSWCSL